jgi:hypothetical protein
MAGSSATEPTFNLFVLGGAPLPKVPPFFKAAYGTTPDAVALFTGPSDNWDGASLNHVIFRQIRKPLDHLPPGVQQAASGRPPPSFVLEATSSVVQPEDVARFIQDNLLPSLADQTGGVVAHPQQGLLYTGDTSASKRALPWNYLDGAPDPEADDWSDLL